MKYYKYWEHCVSKIEDNKITEAIDYARKKALELNVPTELVNKIFSVNLDSFEKKINSNMSECIERGKNENAKALCLYYSLDNGWDSTIYIDKEYSKINNHWIGTSGSFVEIGKARGFSGIYKKDAEAAFFADDISTGICILLMLRTTIAFYNVTINYKDCGFKLCITCTDGDFVTVVG